MRQPQCHLRTPRDLKLSYTIALLVEIAMHRGTRPISAKELSRKHGWPHRTLEPTLQAMARAKILRSVRGPGGGYYLGRTSDTITLGDVIRAANANEVKPSPSANPIVDSVVMIVLDAAEDAFISTLDRVKLVDLVHRTKKLEELCL